MWLPLLGAPTHTYTQTQWEADSCHLPFLCLCICKLVNLLVQGTLGSALLSAALGTLVEPGERQRHELKLFTEDYGS